MPRLPGSWLLALLLPGCATDVPGGVSTTFDDSAGVIEITVLGDGFVRSAGERLPLEALVLTLRQRTRSMSKDERGRFVVHLLAGPHSDDPQLKTRIAADLDRLLGQLQIMGVPHVRYL